jgi:hypothetical protein
LEKNPVFLEKNPGLLWIVRQHFCEPFLRGGIRVTFLPNDAHDAVAAAGGPGAAAAADTRACRVPFPAWHEDLRLPVPAVLRR